MARIFDPTVLDGKRILITGGRCGDLDRPPG
jgi:hypothetical protein